MHHVMSQEYSGAKLNCTKFLGYFPETGTFLETKFLSLSLKFRNCSRASITELLGIQILKMNEQLTEIKRIRMYFQKLCPKTVLAMLATCR